MREIYSYDSNAYRRQFEIHRAVQKLIDTRVIDYDEIPAIRRARVRRIIVLTPKPEYL